MKNPTNYFSCFLCYSLGLHVFLYFPANVFPGPFVHSSVFSSFFSVLPDFEYIYSYQRQSNHGYLLKYTIRKHNSILYQGFVLESQSIIPSWSCVNNECRSALALKFKTVNRLTKSPNMAILTLFWPTLYKY